MNVKKRLFFELLPPDATGLEQEMLQVRFFEVLDRIKTLVFAELDTEDLDEVESALLDAYGLQVRLHNIAREIGDMTEKLNAYTVSGILQELDKAAEDAEAEISDRGFSDAITSATTAAYEESIAAGLDVMIERDGKLLIVNLKGETVVGDAPARIKPAKRTYKIRRD